MSIVLKTVGIAIVTVVLCLFLEKQNKDIAIIISIAACCIIFAYTVNYLEAILDFVADLKSLCDLNDSFLLILLKAVGVSLIGEITSLLCADAGKSAIGKTVQIMAVCTVLWLSLPLFTALLELLNNILGKA